MNKSVLFASMCVAITSLCAAQSTTKPDESQQQEITAIPAAIPPAPQTYMGREIATTMHYTGAPWLVRPGMVGRLAALRAHRGIAA